MPGSCLPDRAAGLWVTGREGTRKALFRTEQSGSRTLSLEYLRHTPGWPCAGDRQCTDWRLGSDGEPHLCRLSLCTTHCESSGGTRAALSLGFPMWAVGRTQGGAAETSRLQHQHARAIFLPATSSHPVSLGPSSQVCLLHPTQWGTQDTVELPAQGR